MNALRILLMSAAIAAASLPAAAQFVRGNEAVRIDATGALHVDSPPLPAGSLAKPCPASTAGCAGGGWHMVETTDGLMECTEMYARPTTCRPSHYGTEKRTRVWIVKRDGQWLQCQFPDLGGTCVRTNALPIAAVQ